MRDLEALSSWHADWSSLRVVVLGLGVTGFAVADTLVELGATVLVVTADAPPERADLLSVIGARLVIDADTAAVPPDLAEFGADLVIASPGYHPRHPLIAWAEHGGIPIWGDIELAWRLRDKSGTPAEWIAVTGTNGKTTTVQLTAHLLRSDGRRAVAVGNIGVPVLDAIRDPQGFDLLVVELSSFQLHWLAVAGPGALAPIASVCLNLADDHLDWHGGRASYALAKSRVYANTRIACVYNRADPATQRMVEEAEVAEGCRAIGFGTDAPGPSDFGVVAGVLLDRAFLDDRHRSAIELTTVDELAGVGLAAPHMVANVLAACALARACGVPAEGARTALTTFALDHHRLEFVAAGNGVRWVDDSKATNPAAADAALGSFDSVVWIVGGLFKGTDLGAVIAAHLGRLRAAVLIGGDRTALAAAFARHAPQLPVFEVVASQTDEVMPEAVRLAAAVAADGDVVLLAPAAASLDQFSDYADRGSRFASAVHNHPGGAGDVSNQTPVVDPTIEG